MLTAIKWDKVPEQSAINQLKSHLKDFTNHFLHLFKEVLKYTQMRWVNVDGETTAVFVS